MALIRTEVVSLVSFQFNRLKVCCMSLHVTLLDMGTNMGILLPLRTSIIKGGPSCVVIHRGWQADGEV